MEQAPLIHALTMALIKDHEEMFSRLPEKVCASCIISRLLPAIDYWVPSERNSTSFP